jgi:hypothetical protein
VRDAFERSVPNAALRGLLNTRIFLRTSVDLKSPHPDHVFDAERIASVCAAIEEFGYSVGLSEGSREPEEAP